MAVYLQLQQFLWQGSMKLLHHGRGRDANRTICGARLHYIAVRMYSTYYQTFFILRVQIGNNFELVNVWEYAEGVLDMVELSC
jgi:hypothetical protein